MPAPIPAPPTPVHTPAQVLILLCTHNGAAFLGPQLDSIAAQEGVDWALWVSDDGSQDGTCALIDAFRARHPDRDIRRLQGPGLGAAQNFLWLLNHPDLPLGPQTHVALCDQDDIWLPGKLARGWAALTAAADAAGPLIYGAQSFHIDASGRRIGQSRRPRRAVSLRNAVVQNMVSGHSLMLNPAGVALARQAGGGAGIAFQDWWLSLLVLACGGRALIDPVEVLLYRQHDGNVLGAPGGLAALRRRLGLLLDGGYARWMAANLAGLASRPLPRSPEAERILAALHPPPKGRLRRLGRMMRLGLYRQGRLGTLLLYAAVVIGRA